MVASFGNVNMKKRFMIVYKPKMVHINQQHTVNDFIFAGWTMK